MNEANLEFPWPRILDRIQNADWCITSAAFNAIISAMEAHANGESMVARSAAASRGREDSRSSGVGVVSISGIIGKRISTIDSICGGVDVNRIVSSVEKMASYDDISTIVMDWDSPGGTVTGIPEAYDILSDIGKSKTLISFCETQMCSGAIWLASAATSMYAANSASVGSIGVYNMTMDRSAQLAKEGVRIDPVSAGKWKLMGAPFKALSSEERAMIQARVDEIHADFKAVVTKGRKVDPAVLEGQVLTGAQALKAGLIDGIYPTLGALLKKLG